MGPLHGLPVSLKDNFNLKGLDATVGFASHVDDPAAYDSTLATILEDAGAVFCKHKSYPSTALLLLHFWNAAVHYFRGSIKDD